MKIGFLKATYPNEKRICFLPKIKLNYKTYIEENYAIDLDIEDYEYKKNGAIILSRDEIFATVDILVSLKLFSEEEWRKLKKNQILIGWIHPQSTALGRKFSKYAKENGIIYFDIDTIIPKIYYMEKSWNLINIPANFLDFNSKTAGKAAILHATLSFNKLIENFKKIAVLGDGNLAFGALEILLKFNNNIDIYKRKNLILLDKKIQEYDLIVNCIEIQENEESIIDEEMSQRIKKSTLLIDAAADPDRAIKMIEPTSWEKPIKKSNNENYYYYCIDNLPTIFYKDVSEKLTETFFKYVFTLDFNKIYEQIINKVETIDLN